MNQISFNKSSTSSSLGHILLAIPTEDQLRRLLGYLLDEDEFLSEYGIRSLSKIHKVYRRAFIVIMRCYNWSKLLIILIYRRNLLL